MPNVKPNRTWFALWTPKYILEIGIKIQIKAKGMYKIFPHFLVPILSDRIGS